MTKKRERVIKIVYTSYILKQDWKKAMYYILKWTEYSIIRIIQTHGLDWLISEPIMFTSSIIQLLGMLGLLASHRRCVLLVCRRIMTTLALQDWMVENSFPSKQFRSLIFNQFWYNHAYINFMRNKVVHTVFPVLKVILYAVVFN